MAPVLPSALKALCTVLGWDQGEFARALGLSRSTLARIETGKSELTEERQEAAKAILGATTEEFDAAIHLATLVFERQQAGGTAPAPDTRRGRLARQFEAVVRDARAFLEAKIREIEVEEAKEAAEQLWQELVARPQKERILRVENCDEFLTPALVARLCDESERAAARKASDAVELADLALRVAKRAPGTEAQRAGRLNQAWAFVGNSRRVSNALREADLAFSSSREFRLQCEGEEPEFFDPARPLGLEASLRRNQGRFAEALGLHEQALQVCWPSARSRILLQQAATFEQEGQPEKALATLVEARPAIERGDGGPRYRWILNFSVVKSLVHLGRGAEAEARLPEVRTLATEIGNDLDRLRTRALSGEVLSITGRPTNALAELEAVRLEFSALSLPADSAIVGLSVAAILLGEGRNAEVRALTQGMRSTFDSLGLERELQAAVRLFLEAVERDAGAYAMARGAGRGSWGLLEFIGRSADENVGPIPSKLKVSRGTNVAQESWGMHGRAASGPAREVQISFEGQQAAKIRVCRAYKGWKQGDLARKARIDPSALSRYEREGGAPSAVMERVLGATEVPPVLAEVFLSSCQVLQGQAGRAVGSERGRAQDLAAEVGSRFAALFAPAFVAMPVGDPQLTVKESPPTAADRVEAEMLFRRLVPLTQDDRLLVVAKGRQFHTPALCERLCEERVHWPAKKVEDALQWADLALCVAERIPGAEAKRAKGMGYAWAFVGNAQRVANVFPAVDAAFARSRALYAMGQGNAPGWFDEARALDLEASLRRDQGRLSEALDLHKRALDSCEVSNRARLFLNLAATLEQDGQPHRALYVLEQAQPEVEKDEAPPRFRWVLRFNVIKNLVHLNRSAAAEALLPELQLLADELDNDLDQLHTRALSGEVLAGLRRWDEALAELSTVRTDFTALKLWADAAIVGLEEAVILLEDLRTAKVRTLVRTMKPIFDSLDLKREALASYGLFVSAVEREAATAAMARELAKAIERAGKRMDGPGAV